MTSSNHELTRYRRKTTPHSFLVRPLLHFILTTLASRLTFHYTKEKSQRKGKKRYFHAVTESNDRLSINATLIRLKVQTLFKLMSTYRKKSKFYYQQLWIYLLGLMQLFYYYASNMYRCTTIFYYKLEGYWHSKDYNWLRIDEFKFTPNLACTIARIRACSISCNQLPVYYRDTLHVQFLY